MSKIIGKIEHLLNESWGTPKDFQYQFPDWKEIGHKYIQKTIKGLVPLIKKKYPKAIVKGSWDVPGVMPYVGTSIELNTKWHLEIRWVYNANSRMGFIEPVIALSRKGSGQKIQFNDIKDLWEKIQAHIKQGW